MKLHEYQAKAILARHGIAVPPGGVASTAAEAGDVARRLGSGPVVVKAQIHAGGRGKGGGIRLAASPLEAERIAGDMLGMRLVTHQTGPDGRIVSKVLVESALSVARELYVGLVIDRVAKRVVVIASPDGGVEIEAVAAKTPERIFRQHVHPAAGLMPFQGRALAFALGLEAGAIQKAAGLVASLYRAFSSTDASLVEVNPLVLTQSGDLLALDAKMTLDDTALDRHPDLRALRDLGEEDSLEVEASTHSLNYIRLSGTLGCMVNGAGLAMATMDIIKLSGGEPANFLDVGGGANPEQIRHAFEILVADRNVRAVLINIFGGILRCDLLAQGLIAAAREREVHVPIVIRLEGTNVEEGRRLLRESGLNFTTADSMGEAALEAVRLAGAEGAGAH